MDPGLNNLLKWSLANAGAPHPGEAHSSTDTPASTNPASAPAQRLNAEALKVLMGGPSDAELMQSSMAAIRAPDVALADKMVAFDNLEQLIESIDNANNMQTLGLWTPLVGLLRSEEAGLRRMAAWCMGTAVQNNAVAQERVCFISFDPLHRFTYNPPSRTEFAATISPSFPHPVFQTPHVPPRPQTNLYIQPSSSSSAPSPSSSPSP